MKNSLNDSYLMYQSPNFRCRSQTPSTIKNNFKLHHNQDRLARSPIQVRQNYNLGEKNTIKLWGEFQDHLLNTLNLSDLNLTLTNYHKDIEEEQDQNRNGAQEQRKNGSRKHSLQRLYSISSLSRSSASNVQRKLQLDTVSSKENSRSQHKLTKKINTMTSSTNNNDSLVDFNPSIFLRKQPRVLADSTNFHPNSSLLKEPPQIEKVRIDELFNQEVKRNHIPKSNSLLFHDSNNINEECPEQLLSYQKQEANNDNQYSKHTSSALRTNKHSRSKSIGTINSLLLHDKENNLNSTFTNADVIFDLLQTNQNCLLNTKTRPTSQVPQQKTQIQKLRSYRTTPADLISVQQRAESLIKQKKFNDAIALLQSYQKHANYLCSPDQPILKSLHLYLIAVCRNALGVTGIIQLCEQSLALLNERALGQSKTLIASVTYKQHHVIGLRLHIELLKAKVHLRNGVVESSQLQKAIASLRHIIQIQMTKFKIQRNKAADLVPTTSQSYQSPLQKHLIKYSGSQFPIQQAKAKYAQALMLTEKWDQSIKIYQALVKALEETLSCTKAKSLCNQVLTDLLNYYNQLGNCYTHQKRHENALKCYIKSRNIIRGYALNVCDTVKAKIVSNIAVLYINLDCGRQRQAITLLQESLQIKRRYHQLHQDNSSLIQGYLMLAKACIKIKQFKPACKAYKQALEIAFFVGDPELSLNIVIDYSTALRCDGNNYQAIQALQNSIESDTQNIKIDVLVKTWKCLIQFYLELKMLDRCKELVKKIYAYLDRNEGVLIRPSVYMNIGQVLFQGGEKEQALLVYLKALKQFQGFKPIQRGGECDRFIDVNRKIGECYDEIGMFDDAQKYYNKVLKILKQFAPSKNTLLDQKCGEIYLKLAQLQLRKREKSVLNRDNALFYFKQAEKSYNCSHFKEQSDYIMKQIKKEIANLSLARSYDITSFFKK